MSKRILLFTCCFLMSVFAFSQGKTITGKVTDEKGEPLSGVTVLQRGEKSGTQTDGSGNFSLSIKPTRNEIVVSSIGFKTETIGIGSRAVVNVTLQQNVTSGEEVVVVGYSSVKRRDLLQSVSSVSAKDLKDIPINSASEALNGRLAGVTASTSEGSPDAQITVRVRGGMSISQDNSPLYIIDGVQVESGLSAVSPQDIATIDVLKDASATAIYGARGANGVIVITTKSGKPGKMQVSYNGFVGFKYLPKTLGVLSPYEFVLYQSERSRGSVADSTSFGNNFGTTWDTLSNYRNVAPVNWQEEVFGNTGIQTTQNVTASGGNKKFIYNFGYTYNEDQAVVINSKFQRHLLNFKGDYKIRKNLKFGLSTRYTNQDVFGAGVSSTQGSSYNRLRNAVKYRPFLSEGQDIDDQDQYADPNVGNGLNLVNPIALANAEYRRRSTEAINVTANINWNITKNLSFRSTFGYDNNNIIDRTFSDSITPYSIIQGGRRAIAGLDTLNRRTFTNSNVLNYKISKFKGKHDFDFLVGQETYEFQTESETALFRDFPTFTSFNDAFKNPSLGASFVGFPRRRESKYTNASFFSSINYSFKDKYLFMANVRADGASKFAPGQQWGYFPSASVAWRVSKEKFMENVKFIDDLKFRYGYGTIGNNRINDYLFLTTFSNDGRFFYGLNGQSVNGFYPTSLTNPNLRWESTINSNLGMDITMFKDRITLSVDVYNNNSDNLLLNVPIASTYGYQNQLQNIGKTNNKGIEFQLGLAIVQKKDFNWNANFNLSSNRNKVVQLGVNQPFFFPDPSWGVNGQPTDYIVRIGDPVGSMFGLVTDGFYTTDDFDYNPTGGGYGTYTIKAGVPTYGSGLGIVQPGAIRYKDLDGDGIVDFNNDRQIIGNPTPKFTGGLNQQFSYKRWDASVFMNFSIGNDIYNANKIELSNGFTPNSNLLDIMEGRWRVVTPDGATAQYVSAGNAVVGIAPELLSALNANATIWQPARGTGAAAFTPHSWAIEDGSFLRLNNITIGYSFPKASISKLRMTRLRLYATANNLAVFTNYSGYDPEVSVRNSPLTPGLDYSAYPKSRSFLFGVNASF